MIKKKSSAVFTHVVFLLMHSWTVLCSSPGPLWELEGTHNIHKGSVRAHKYARKQLGAGLRMLKEMLRCPKTLHPSSVLIHLHYVGLLSLHSHSLAQSRYLPRHFLYYFLFVNPLFLRHPSIKDAQINTSIDKHCMKVICNLTLV